MRQWERDRRNKARQKKQQKLARAQQKKLVAPRAPCAGQGSVWQAGKKYRPGDKVEVLGLNLNVSDIKEVNAFKAPLATIKDSNPKDAIGISKIPLGSVIPGQVLVGMALGMLEGACKYRRHNYRVVGVRSSVYYDAAKRHLDAWWEGQDMDPEAAIPIHHLDKLLSDIAVLRDAMLQDKVYDDRPPPVKNQRWIQEANERTKELLAKFPNAKPPYTINDETEK